MFLGGIIYERKAALTGVTVSIFQKIVVLEAWSKLPSNRQTGCAESTSRVGDGFANGLTF